MQKIFGPQLNINNTKIIVVKLLNEISESQDYFFNLVL